MKLEPIFTSDKNKLTKIEDKSIISLTNLQTLSAENISSTKESFTKLLIKWSSVELDTEVYNEELLAKLRDDLKILDEKGLFVILVPLVDKKFENPEDAELFTNAFNHTARRIKDCTCIAGIELPYEILSQNSYTNDFIETLSKKHSQYVYFATEENLSKLNLLQNLSETTIIKY